MDDRSVGFKEDRFNQIKNEVSVYLKKIGYNKEIPFIPISGWCGDNLVKSLENMDWYKGPSLIEALDSVKIPKRPILKPLRIPIIDVYKISGVGTVAIGRVETGVLIPNMKITFGPLGLTTECKSIEMHHESLAEAKPGDCIGFNVKNLSVRDIYRGMVASDASREPAMDTAYFKA